MLHCYNVKRIRNVNFLVTGLQDLGKPFNGLNRSEITFRSKIVGKELDKLICNTNTVRKIKTANIFQQQGKIKTTESSLIIYVDLSKVNNVIHDNMYKYMLTKISDILKEEKRKK